MSDHAIHYPINFGTRPCDRMLHTLLKSAHPDLTPHACFGLIYQAWMEFATGGDTKRPIKSKEPEQWTSDPQILTIESFLGLPGFCALALQAEFAIIIETPEGDLSLSWKGYIDFNNHLDPKAVSQVKRGGYAKSFNAKLRSSQLKDDLNRDLWEGISREMAQETGTDPLIIRTARNFALKLCHCFDIDEPAPDLVKRYIPAAIDAVKKHGQDSLSRLLFHIHIQRKNDPAFPQKPDLIIQDLDRHIREALENPSSVLTGARVTLNN